MATGPWTIVIQGTGPYQNDTDPNSIYYDAEKLLRAYTEALANQGHTIQAAGLQIGQPNPVVSDSSLNT